MKKLALTAVATLVAAPLVAATATPASAKSMWIYRSSGSEVSISWTELGPLNGVGGNVHVGSLTANTGEGFAYGEVLDWTCPEGELPPHGGGGHGFEEEEPETNCVLESYRDIWADGTLDVTIDRKMNVGRITGTVEVSNHETGTGGSPAVDITLTGFGDISSSTYYETYSSGGSTFTYKNVSDWRQATVSGAIGAMDFDEPDDVANGSMSTYKSYERGRTS